MEEFNNEIGAPSIIASLMPWLFYVVGLGITLYIMSQGHSFWESYLFGIVISNGGIQGIWAAMGHLLFPEKTAASIGWQTCAFQREVGFANLAIGITSLSCLFFHYWTVPIAVMIAIYYSGCVYGHLYELWINKNNAPCNAGPMLYCTALVAISMIIGVLLQ